MTDRNSENKSFTQKDESGSDKTQAESKTGVHPYRKHGVGIWGNPRVTMTVRVDEGLKKRFVPFSKRVFNSVCLPIEAWMAGLLGTVVEAEKKGVYPSATIPLKVDVGKIVIERNLRERRKLEFEKPETPQIADEEPRCGFCGKPLVVARFRHVKTGVEREACDYHTADLRKRSDWEEIP